MDTTARISGVAIPIAVTPALAAIRSRWDLAASQGAEPHVTILYPFLDEDRLDGSVRVALTAVAATVEPFDVRFARVQRFDTVVWLDPDPADPFRALTAAMAEHWPDHPPYGGVHDEVIPHLTVAEADPAAAPFDAIEAAAGDVIPFTSRAEAMELWLQDDTGHWRPHWRFPLGVRP